MTEWARCKSVRLQEKRLEYLKATEKRHYREFHQCTEAGKDLGRLAALKRAYANETAFVLGEDHNTVLDARREALMYGEQSQQEYEAADFHYAAYIEARDAYSKT
jgi:hypothetical protein